MAKKLFPETNELKDFIESTRAQLAAFEKDLSTKKYKCGTSNKLEFEFNFNKQKDKRKALLNFSLKAWTKMRALVDQYETEIQWHGLVERTGVNEFLVTDILIFPHKVTGATVTSDYEEYQKWLFDLEDETFEQLRFHGHSHVNMGVTPSGTDTTYRRGIVDGFPSISESTDSFYIFFITNKSMSFNVEIYDLQNNALYSTDEVVVEVQTDSDEFLSEFLAEAKSCVSQKTCTPASSSKHADSTANTKSYSNYDENWFRRLYGGSYR